MATTIFMFLELGISRRLHCRSRAWCPAFFVFGEVWEIVLEAEADSYALDSLDVGDVYHRICELWLFIREDPILFAKLSSLFAKFQFYLRFQAVYSRIGFCTGKLRPNKRLFPLSYAPGRMTFLVVSAISVGLSAEFSVYPRNLPVYPRIYRFIRDITGLSANPRRGRIRGTHYKKTNS